MRVTRSALAAHRAAMLDQASRLFRSRGVERVAVADITAAAGMTHGAFYGHFPSKSALVTEAFATAMRDSAARWRQRAAEARDAGRDPLAELVRGYLSARHRDAPATGCALASLGGELLRDDAMAAPVLAGIDALAEVLTEEVARARPDRADPRGAALAMLAMMQGGLLLARALAADPVGSDALLARVADASLASIDLQ